MPKSMLRQPAIAFALAVCLPCVALAADKEPPADPKAKIEFRWLSATPVPDLTEKEGIQTTCGPESMYPHLRPVLTQADVATATCSEHDFTSSGLGVLYTVEFRFTDKAREKLVRDSGDRPTRELAVFVDGAYSGAWYFRQAEAEDFKPLAGFIASKSQAERIVAACK